MILNSFKALNAFAKQLERHVSGSAFQTKVVVTPSSIKEKGVVIKVSLLKRFFAKRAESDKSQPHAAHPRNGCRKRREHDRLAAGNNSH